MAKTSLNSKLRKSKGSGKEDRLSNLSDDLLSRIVSDFSTKDSIRFTTLSKRWRKLWLSVPALDLDTRNFNNDGYGVFEFMDKFLEFNQERDVKRFKLIYDPIEHDHEEFVSRIDDVVKRRVCDLTILNLISFDEDCVRMPLSLYSCATLVKLTLYCVDFDSPKSELISLPCVKTMHLEAVKFDGKSTMEAFISSCLVLQELTIVTHPDDDDELRQEYFCVRSQSLKSFILESRRDYEESEGGDVDVEMDTPRLEYMRIRDYRCQSFTIHSIGRSAMVKIDVKLLDLQYDDPLDRSMIFDFLTAISTVREMIISAQTLEIFRGYSKPLPEFSNLTHLEASFDKSTWEFLPSFLGCCPNLQALVLEYGSLSETDKMNFVDVPQCFVSSLEFVELKTPVTVMDTSTKMKLSIYFIRNCAVLKKLVVSEGSDTLIKKIKKIPKRSPRCEVVVVKQNYNVVPESSSLLSAMY